MKNIEYLTIHKIIGGSHLYGFATPESDIDIRGVCLSPVDALIGLKRFDQYQKNDAENDIVIYELRKFCKLALGANPNIADLLFCPPDRWLLGDGEFAPDSWNRIYNIRHSFLSQRIRKTFGGYAHSQLKRIKGHRKWLQNPPKKQPVQSEYGAEAVDGSWIFPHITAEKKYKGDLKTWNQYQTWLKNRNPKRAEMERKFGFDTKHGKHLARLMLQATNILQHGDYNPVLSGDDLKTVKAVGSGEWSYNRLVGWSEEVDLAIHEMDSDLPEKPDFNLVNDTVVEIYREYLQQ